MVTPSASPPAEGAEVVAAFISEFGQRQPPFHVDGDIFVTGSAGSESLNVSIEVNGDISGQDFDGEVILPGRGRVRVRYVDGVGYARIGRGKWMSVPGEVQKQPTNPFSLLDMADLQYIGKQKRGGRTLHQLRTNKWIGADFEEQGFTNVKFDSNEFNIYVSNKGIPVEAVLEVTLSATFSGKHGTFDYHVVYHFSDVGEPVDIRAPI